MGFGVFAMERSGRLLMLRRLLLLNKCEVDPHACASCGSTEEPSIPAPICLIFVVVPRCVPEHTVHLPFSVISRPLKTLLPTMQKNCVGGPRHTAEPSLNTDVEEVHNDVIVSNVTITCCFTLLIYINVVAFYG